jgi:DNA-binding GntR family transcriptional regulator
MERSWQDLLEAQRQELFLDALRLDAEFLTTLYTAADNQALLHLIQSLWDRVQPYRVLWTATAKERDGVEAWRYNAEILEAAKARDGDWAARATMASLESAQAVLEALIVRNS